MTNFSIPILLKQRAHIKFSFLYKIPLTDRFEDHKEGIDELTCICAKGGSFRAVSSMAGAKEDPVHCLPDTLATLI